MLFGGLGINEIVVIALLVLLLFGGKKIPELMKGLGSGIREFNDAKNNIKSEIDSEMRELEKPNVERKEKVKEENDKKA